MTLIELIEKCEYTVWDIQTNSDPEHVSCGGINYGLALVMCNDLLRTVELLQAQLEKKVLEEAIQKMGDLRDAHAEEAKG